MNQDMQAPDWIQAYLEWDDQGRGENRPASGSDGDSAARASEQFVSAYLEWIDTAVLEVRPDRNVNTRQIGQYRRKASRQATLERTTALPQGPSPVTGARVHPA